MGRLSQAGAVHLYHHRTQVHINNKNDLTALHISEMIDNFSFTISGIVSHSLYLFTLFF